MFQFSCKVFRIGSENKNLIFCCSQNRLGQSVARLVLPNGHLDIRGHDGGSGLASRRHNNCGRYGWAYPPTTGQTRVSLIGVAPHHGHPGAYTVHSGLAYWLMCVQRRLCALQSKYCLLLDTKVTWQKSVLQLCQQINLVLCWTIIQYYKSITFF